MNYSANHINARENPLNIGHPLNLSRYPNIYIDQNTLSGLSALQYHASMGSNSSSDPSSQTSLFLRKLQGTIETCEEFGGWMMDYKTRVRDTQTDATPGASTIVYL